MPAIEPRMPERVRARAPERMSARGLVGAPRPLLGPLLGIALAGVVPGVAADASPGVLPGAPLVVEGDILVAQAGLRGVGTLAPDRRWPNGEIPYRIDATLDATRARAIAEAVRHWNDVSGVTLVALAADDEWPFDHLVFQDGPGCASWVGRQGGPQEVWIGPSCTSGSVMHEIGHALGLEHEHTRPDRDEHVRVLWDNVVPDKRHNFATAPPGTRPLGDYDIDSIMHYGPSNFSLDGGPTLEALVPGADANMGQRDAPSPGDVAAVARLYASDLALVLGTDDERRASEVTLHVTNHHEQGAHDVRVALAADADGFAANGAPPTVGGDPDWRCAARAGLLECRLARLEGHATSRVVLELDAPLDARALVATVGSKTPDLDPGNNRGQAVDGAAEPALAAATAAFADSVAAVDDAGGDAPVTAFGGAGGPFALALLALLGASRRRPFRTYCAGN